MSSRVTVKGAHQLAASLDTFTDSLQHQERADAEAAAVLTSRLRQTAPHRTGQLAASIGPSKAAGSVRVVVGVRYAAPVISGVPSRGIRPNRFADRTTKAAEPALQKVYEQQATQDAAKIRGA
jgi:hypothetical protein